MIKVLIADDHSLIRKGIAMLLEAEEDIEIAGEASTGSETFFMAERLNPDVVLLDISMPGDLDGLKTASKIKREVPGVKVIMLTMHEEDGYVRRAAETGAEGFLLKKVQDNNLYEAVKAVYRGEIYYKTNLPEEKIKEYFKVKGKLKPILSPREEEIIILVVNGYSNQEIAEKLFISPKTVENHKMNIMSKLELNSRSELIQYGLKNHYVK
ncbi:MAG: DNA-binding response regulator [Alkalicoccus sp.]|nr:MAG: DNA-binding response regulator [Alkalicoccus sp.]